MAFSRHSAYFSLRCVHYRVHLLVLQSPTHVLNVLTAMSYEVVCSRKQQVDDQRARSLAKTEAKRPPVPGKGRLCRASEGLLNRVAPRLAVFGLGLFRCGLEPRLLKEGGWWRVSPPSTGLIPRLPTRCACPSLARLLDAMCGDEPGWLRVCQQKWVMRGWIG